MLMSNLDARCQNRLLSALPGPDLDRIRPSLQLIQLQGGQLLYDGERTLAYVYFPASALVSMLCTTNSGDMVEVALIGADGMVGMNFTDALEWTPARAVVGRDGQAWRLPGEVMRQEFARGGALQQLALRYAQLLMAQIAQTVLCNRFHTLDQQLCRWVLMSLERGGSDQVQVTQQQLASTLGVRREAVSGAASRLEKAGVLYWGRGRLRVIDRARLEQHCCECHSVLRGMGKRLFNQKPRER